MTLLFPDTSALFKRYVEEDESEAVLARIEEASENGAALITRVEVAAALAKAVRDSRMAPADAREAEREFLDDWTVFTRIRLTNSLAVRAGDLTWRHGLRGYDAVQLAAALAWQESAADPADDIEFACFDNHLRRAASAEGLKTWPKGTEQ